MVFVNIKSTIIYPTELFSSRGINKQKKHGLTNVWQFFFLLISSSNNKSMYKQNCLIIINVEKCLSGELFTCHPFGLLHHNLTIFICIYPKILRKTISNKMVFNSTLSINELFEIYFRPVAGMPSLLTVMLSRRMFGLSYSSIDMPRDRRRGPRGQPSFDPPELVEKARPRSMPGIQTDVKRPWPLQNSKID